MSRRLGKIDFVLCFCFESSLSMLFFMNGVMKFRVIIFLLHVFFSAIICLWFLLCKCSIDLKKNVLVIGTTGSKTTFLPEGELPECARLAYGPGRDEVRPEEIADQELAEALQKSVEDAGIWNGQALE